MNRAMIHCETELNPEQFSVVEHGDGPCLVLAGAGSGKTRTITYRVVYLLEKGIAPENILLVTFTNKAAAEMKARIAKLINRRGEVSSPSLSKGGGTPPLQWSGTFHHIAYRILKTYAPLLGYQNNFSVLDSDDSESILKLCIKEVKTTDGKKFPSASVVSAIISYSRNAEQMLETTLESRFYQWSQVLSELQEVARLYALRKKEANAMDFDDLLVNLLVLLNDEKIRTKFASQFQYVLVDEYQDTNKIQASIVRKFSSVHNNVLVVGDDAQSIYSFRAADIGNILHFTQQYPGAQIFKLETNYRSGQEILEVANNVIANNREQYKKHLRAMEQHGIKPELWPQIDQQSEASFIRKRIQKHLDEGVPASEIAVLFRASHHSQMLEVELVSSGIEYDYRGGVRFFERAHIKDILSYLRILNNVADTAAWLRVLMHEEGIGPAAAQKVVEAVRLLVRKGEVSSPSPIYDASSQGGETPPLPSIGEIGHHVLGAKAQTGWNNFVNIWGAMLAAPEKVPAILIDALAASPYKEYLETEFIDSRDRMQDIKQLALFAQRYETLAEFLAEATLQESFRAIDSSSPPTSTENGRIVLSTIHQAKGLEWSVVFIINLSAGAFPSERSLREENGVEEERRLLYVAVTRAKKYLYLTYPMAGGSFGDFMSGPSSFLNEIESGLLDDHSLLSISSTVFDDPNAGVRYVSEDDEIEDYDEYNRKPKKIKPGSFLIDINDF